MLNQADSLPIFTMKRIVHGPIPLVQGDFWRDDSGTMHQWSEHIWHTLDADEGIYIGNYYSNALYYTADINYCYNSAIPLSRHYHGTVWIDVWDNVWYYSCDTNKFIKVDDTPKAEILDRFYALKTVDISGLPRCSADEAASKYNIFKQKLTC
jgi:hypothetical protein